MDIRPLSELADRVRGRSVAIVGNAPSLLGSGLGSQIDACDLVVRMNNYVLRDDWRNNIGTKADIYLCSFCYGHDKIDKPVDEIRRHRFIVCPSLEMRDSWNLREFAASLVGDGVVYAPQAEDVAGMRQYLGEARPTTGFAGVYLFLQLLTPRSVLMCGFDCFSNLDNVHYFENRAHTGFSHDPDREKSAFLKLTCEHPNVVWHERERLEHANRAAAAGGSRRIHLCKTDLCSRRDPDHLRLREYFIRNGHTIVGTPDESDCIVLNTCSSNQFTEDNSMRAAEELGKAGKELVVVGCLPRAAGARLAGVFGGKTARHREFSDLDPRFSTTTPYATLEKNPCRLPVLTDSSQAFGRPGHCYQIQSSWGCNDHCTYCGDKAAVGALCSRPLQELIEEATATIQSGASYLAIVGDDVAALGIDQGYSVFDLLEAIVALPGDYTLDLYEMNPKYLVGALPRLARLLGTGHFGELTVAYQSGNDRVLQLMGRGYTSAQVRDLVALMHDNDVSVYAHVLVGMPGETESEFQESLDVFEQMQIEGGSFFAYQNIARAPAYRMSDKISESRIQNRLLRAAETLAMAGYEVVHREDKIQCRRVEHPRRGDRPEACWMRNLRADRERAASHFDTAVRRCVDAGLRRVAIYGTGQHSWRLVQRFIGCPLSIAGFIEDKAVRRGRLFLGLPTFTLSDALTAGVQAVIISTDRYESAIAQRIRPALQSAGVCLVTLYEGRTPAIEWPAGTSARPSIATPAATAEVTAAGR